VTLLSAIFYFIPAYESWAKFIMLVFLYSIMACGVLLAIDQEFRLQTSGIINAIFNKFGRRR